jgi:hypothetical protein
MNYGPAAVSHKDNFELLKYGGKINSSVQINSRERLMRFYTTTEVDNFCVLSGALLLHSQFASWMSLDWRHLPVT